MIVLTYYEIQLLLKVANGEELKVLSSIVLYFEDMLKKVSPNSYFYDHKKYKMYGFLKQVAEESKRFCASGVHKLQILQRNIQHKMNDEYNQIIRLLKALQGNWSIQENQSGIVDWGIKPKDDTKWEENIRRHNLYQKTEQHEPEVEKMKQNQKPEVYHLRNSKHAKDIEDPTLINQPFDDSIVDESGIEITPDELNNNEQDEDDDEKFDDESVTSENDSYQTEEEFEDESDEDSLISRQNSIKSNNEDKLEEQNEHMIDAEVDDEQFENGKPKHKVDINEEDDKMQVKSDNNFDFEKAQQPSEFKNPVLENLQLDSEIGEKVQITINPIKRKKKIAHVFVFEILKCRDCLKDNELAAFVSQN